MGVYERVRLTACYDFHGCPQVASDMRFDSVPAVMSTRDMGVWLVGAASRNLHVAREVYRGVLKTGRYTELVFAPFRWWAEYGSVPRTVSALRESSIIARAFYDEILTNIPVLTHATRWANMFIPVEWVSEIERLLPPYPPSERDAARFGAFHDNSLLEQIQSVTQRLGNYTPILLLVPVFTLGLTLYYYAGGEPFEGYRSVARWAARSKTPRDAIEYLGRYGVYPRMPRDRFITICESVLAGILDHLGGDTPQHRFLLGRMLEQNPVLRQERLSQAHAHFASFFKPAEFIRWRDED